MGEGTGDARAGLEGGGLRPEAAQPWQWGILLLLVIATAYLLLRLRRRQSAGAAPAGAAPEIPRPAAAGRSREAERLQVELHEFAREIEGRLDTKIAFLKRLIADAERAGRDLDRLLDEAGARRSGAKDDPPEAPPRGEEGEEPAENGERPAGAERAGVRARILALHESGKRPAEIAAAAGIPLGEVQLIIGLHRRERESAG